MLFNDRCDAGRQLVVRLQSYKKDQNTIVVGLARGGVVTAFEIAQGLELPLDVLVVRKVGAPDNEELALGAVSETGEGIFNDHLIGVLGVAQGYITKHVEKERKLAVDRSTLYRGKKPFPNFKKKTVILVDDGIATGASMHVAIKSIRKCGAEKIVLAIPVEAPDSLQRLQKDVDEVVCLSAPTYFFAVGSFYKEFEQTSDEEIIRLLSKIKHI